ncbi:MAG: Asp23/Gls24 family envelope stress response protein [Bacilli bacterium]|nr:Asp23/Gls24 family envelope stress response protein [Bacilli bacterium]
MFNKYQYRRIINFTTYGNLGISSKVIEEICYNTIKEIKGVILPDNRSLLLKSPIDCKFKKNGDLFIELHIIVDYGYNVTDICNYVQERVEQSLLFLVEMKAKKISVHVDNIKTKRS